MVCYELYIRIAKNYSRLKVEPVSGITDVMTWIHRSENWNVLHTITHSNCSVNNEDSEGITHDWYVTGNTWLVKDKDKFSDAFLFTEKRTHTFTMCVILSIFSLRISNLYSNKILLTSWEICANTTIQVFMERV